MRVMTRPSMLPSTPHAAARLNRACALLSLTWLAVTVPLGLRFRPTYSDFAQFYMGGLLLRQGHAEAIYPTPTSPFENPGLATDSIASPLDERLRHERGVPNDTRFMLPPPS